MIPRLFPFAFGLLMAGAFAADPRGDNPDAPPSTPQEQLAKFHVPPGFEVQLVAAEPEIQKPMNLNFDAAGRLWVTGSEMYPWPASVDANNQPIADFAKAYAEIGTAFRVGDKIPPPRDAARDSVRVLSDFSPEGRARKIEVFADGLNIPIGVQPLPRDSPAIAAVYGLRPRFDPNPSMQKPGPFAERHLAKWPKGDSAIVFSIPNIWLMTDWNGDGQADKREPLYTGFAFEDTHGMSSNYIYWIDGWIYGCHGFRNRSEVRDTQGRVTALESGNTYRFRPDGSAFEIYSHGQTNPFGLAFDPLGNLYSADSHSKPVYMLLRGGYYEGIGKQHDGLGFAPRITDDDHGSSSIAGIAYYADDKFPEEYRGNLFNGNPVTRMINRAKLEWHGSTPKAIRQPDFVTCDDPWFRPVQVKLGPDGALYIADFYNPIIGHYEVPLTDPRRDTSHGRIWRVVYRGEDGDAPPLANAPDLSRLDAAALVEKLADPSLEVRRLATSELVDHTRDGGKALEAMIKGSDGTGRSHALWVIERMRPARDQLLQAAADPKTSPAQARATVAQILGERAEWKEVDTRLLETLLDDKESIVHRHAASALVRSSRPENLPLLLKLAATSDNLDPEANYGLKVALRDLLATEESYASAGELARDDKAAAELLADVSLAVKTKKAAQFVFEYLEQTDLSTPRAGDYLKHAALHLSDEKLPALFASITRAGDAPLPQRLTIADALTQAPRQRSIKLPEETAAWAQRTMLEALASKDTALLKRGIEAVRDEKFPAKRAPLAKIVRSPKRDGALRVAALEAVANLPVSRTLLQRTLDDPSHMILRKRAAELLAQNGQTAVVLAALPNAPQELAQAIGGALAKTDAGATALLAAVEAGKTSPRLLLNKAIAGALLGRPQPLRERALALTKDLPPEDARLNALIAERTTAFDKATPDLTRGAQIFQQSCAACHRFRNEGGNVGPNLDGVVARGAARLIEDIVDPSRNVDPLFRQTIFETTDGNTLAGANVREEGETVLFADPTGKEITLAKAKIKQRTPSALSLMPPAFEAALPAADFNDLLGFLLSPTPKP